jgi:hypothetical protein
VAHDYYTVRVAPSATWQHSLQGAQSMAMAVFSARLKTRHLLTTKIKSLKQFRTWSSPIVIPTEAKEELFWVARPPPLSQQKEIFVDAQIWVGVFWRATTCGLANERRKKEVGTSTRRSFWWYGKLDRTPMDEQEHQGDVRQYGNYSICEQLRRDSVWRSPSFVSPHMECLPANRHQTIPPVRCIDSKSSRCSISANGIATRMEDSCQILCPSRLYVGFPQRWVSWLVETVTISLSLRPGSQNREPYWRMLCRWSGDRSADYNVYFPWDLLP